MFIENKYRIIYDSLMKRSRLRSYDSNIHEKHHIIPKSMGGDNSLSNIAILTFREHFLAHRLLVKITKGNNKSKMVFALMTFFYFDYKRRGKIKQNDSRSYEYYKSMFIQALKNREPKYNKELYHFKHIETEEEFYGTGYHFIKYSGISAQDFQHLKGGKMYNIKKWSIWLNDIGMFSNERYRAPPKVGTKICEHCNKTISSGNYSRWHGTNCKLINPAAHIENTKQIRNLNKLT